MKTPITVECGPDSETKLIFHEEILCCYSKQIQELFLKAKPARMQLAKADKLREQVAAFVFPEVTGREFEDGHLEQKVCLLSLPPIWTTGLISHSRY